MPESEEAEGLVWTRLGSTKLDYTIQCILYSTYSTKLYSTIVYYTILSCTELYFTILQYTTHKALSRILFGDVLGEILRF